MKIQDLAIIFVLIILPISLVLSAYTQYQIKTLNTQTLYDAQLTAATYDAIKAYQINAENSTTSELSNSKIRDIEASVSTFKNSIMSAFRLNGYSEEELNNYIPALVYTMYDGFYIYSPYENINHQYDESGDEAQGNGENIYGLKPYIPYSCRYIYPKNNFTNPTIDVTITYALDNYITIQGMIDGKYVNESGYLIDGIQIEGNTVTYNGITIKSEQLKEYFIGSTEQGIPAGEYPYAKSNGTKYYLIGEKIIYLSNGKITVQCEKTTNPNEYEKYEKLITNNDQAIQYYKNAKNFTDRVRNQLHLIELAFENAYDVDGKTQLWPDNKTKIFEGGSVDKKHIENELSNFNQHRLEVIRYTIESNLSLAIANYNNYSKSTTNDFQMPKLKEDEWDYITHNISLISFLQGLHIGGKIYNGYTIVTNSESKEVVLESDIYILGKDSQGKKTYHKIGDIELENATITVDVGNYANITDNRSAGRLNLDFKRKSIIDNNQTIYYYPLDDYNASYTSVIMQDNVNSEVYKDIYEYVNNYCSDDVKTAFYIALGRERESQYKGNNNLLIESSMPEPEEPEAKKPSELFALGELDIGDFVNYDAGTWTQTKINSIKTGLKTSLVTANGSTSLPNIGFQFGGFTAGSNRNGNATPHNTTYNYVKKASTNEAISGWRVFDIDGDTVTLISAGNSEDYYHPNVTNSAYISEYILTGNVNGSWSNGTTESQNYQKRDWGDYINTEQKAERATVLTESKLNSWYTKYTNTANANTNIPSTFQKIYTDSEYYKYQSMIDNYSFYWLCATQYSKNGVVSVHPSVRGVYYTNNVAYGVRVLVTLSSDVKFYATKAGTKTLTGGNMSKYGGNQTYNVWNIKP